MIIFTLLKKQNRRSLDYARDDIKLEMTLFMSFWVKA